MLTRSSPESGAPAVDDGTDVDEEMTLLPAVLSIGDGFATREGVTAGSLNMSGTFGISVVEADEAVAEGLPSVTKPQPFIPPGFSSSSSLLQLQPMFLKIRVNDCTY